MPTLLNHKARLDENGFSIIENIYSDKEIAAIIEAIEETDTTKPTFRKTADLFAIRQFLKEVPLAQELVLNRNFKSLIYSMFGSNYFVVKSIYFDKPEVSNWFVAYHQDLTISVKEKENIAGFGPWTTKQGQFAVQPPLNILQNIYTIRIHLDDANEQNGALKIIPKSHLKGIYRPETINWNIEQETICNVTKGGIMFMKPLLLHGSNKATNHQKRRVIHIEISNLELPNPLQWAEKLVL